MVLTDVHDCLSSVNPIVRVKSLQETAFVDQVTSDIYDYNNKVFISLDYIHHNTEEELQNLLNNKDQKGSELQLFISSTEYLPDPMFFV